MDKIPDHILYSMIPSYFDTHTIVNVLSICSKRFRSLLKEHVNLLIQFHNNDQQYFPPKSISDSGWRIRGLDASGKSWQSTRLVTPKFIFSINRYSLIKELYLNYTNVNGTEFKHLPHLEVLSLRGCLNVSQISSDSLPPRLKKLDLYWCKLVQDTTKMYDCHNLEELNISYCSGISSIDSLPPSLLKLSMSSCRRIKSIENISHNHYLIELDISYCTSIMDISFLPQSIKMLDISGCTAIRDIEMLPRDLIKLNMTGCIGVSNISFRFSNYNRLERLRELNLSECSLISDVSELPMNIRNLCLFGCPNIKNISNLPPHLEVLDVSCCPGIYDLSNIPETIVKLKMINSGVSDSMDIHQQINPNKFKHLIQIEI